MTADLALVDPAQLLPGLRAYNNGICAYRGRLLMAYRLGPFEGPDRIVIAELRPAGFRPLSNAFVELGGLGDGMNCEDPRLFVFDDRLWLAFTHAAPGGAFAQQLYAALQEDGGVWRGSVNTPRYGRNDRNGIEKNWSFFEAGRELYALYAPWRWEFVRIDRAGRCETVPGDRCEPVWNYGVLSGGTPPQRMADGTFLTLLHSHVGPAWTHPARVYHVLAAVFAPEPPFTLLRISPAPIMSGSDRWPFPPSGAPWCVFPAGHILDGDRLIVSAGINDCRCAFAELSFASLELVAPEFATTGAR